MGARRVEQLEAPVHVGAHEVGGLVDGTIDVRLGREVEHDARPVTLEQLAHERAVAHVAAHELESRVARDELEIADVPRVRELVEDHDLDVAVRGEQMMREVRADESGSAGDQIRLHHDMRSAAPDSLSTRRSIWARGRRTLHELRAYGARSGVGVGKMAILRAMAQSGEV